LVDKIIIKNKTLLLTKKLDQNPKGGREMLSKLNSDALNSILGHQLIIFELPTAQSMKPLEIFKAFRGNIDGLTNINIKQALQLIQRENIRQVFVDGSNLGGFVSQLKRKFPEVQVITFFHNVEVRFFWGALKATKTVRALAVLIINYLAERKATRLSDKRICLSERDDRLLKLIYGRGATHISPIAIIDKFTDQPTRSQTCDLVPFALFVGGNFYANRDGISWFVKNVAKRINIKICIVGHGMENVRAHLEIPGRVEVVGPVDNLVEWYREARFVIAPIFDGSGMKTKVAEALMHGKKVIGTPEAFTGYESVKAAGLVCHSADEFVAAITAAQNEIQIPFDKKLRTIYLQKFSLDAAKKRLTEILL
jgi:glycosyltransferase involved in cell wall biosynthesis